MEEQQINESVAVSSIARDICESIDDIEYALRLMESNIREYNRRNNEIY